MRLGQVWLCGRGQPGRRRGRTQSLVEQDGFGQTGEDLWYLHGDDFSNHVREADLRRQRLSLNEAERKGQAKGSVSCKLVQVFDEEQLWAVRLGMKDG
ncbi:hypothetical protein Baya_16114 [Bagarius yarrelli]|uniref:Uncharacterized protein n=1 Tax=Bagarius yarrelli TaxID=175774 RepID=A0A556VUK2_BAGYA|nr:hypothetical protein Baya_16114 [Bagarius yarrelli]